MTYIRRLILALALSAGLVPAFAQVPPPVPALPDTERRTSYSISASTCACAVGFSLFGDSTDVGNWIEVFVNGVRMAQAGNWTLSSATGTIGSIPLPITNAVLTFTAPQTGTIQIVGARRPRRTSQFNEGAGVPTRNFNVVLSDLTAQNRELWDKTNDVTGRALLSQPGNTVGLLPLPSLCQNKFLGFDATGLIPQCNAGGAGSGNVVGPASSTVGHFAIFNNTTGTLIDDHIIQGSDLPATVRQKLTGTTTLYYRTDGNNNCNGTVNAAGSSGNCAFADPQFCLLYISTNIDRGGFAITCLAGELGPKTFSPLAGGYVCANGFVGAGNTTVAGNHNQATVTTPIASPGIVNWTAHGLTAGSPVYFSGGTLPTGLNATQLFFVIAAGLTTNAFEVSTTVGGAAVNFTGTSSGTQTGHALTTLIDGTANSASGISVQGPCNVIIRDFQIKSPINSLECFGSGASSATSLYWGNIIWQGTPAGNDIFNGRNCNAEQNGTDWINSNPSGGGHIQGGHGGEVRNPGQVTNFTRSVTYGTGIGSYAYASYGGRVVYTGAPVINLNGFTVTGQRCFAEVNGIMEQAGLGATFFPGNSVCSTATGGQLVQ